MKESIREREKNPENQGLSGVQEENENDRKKNNQNISTPAQKTLERIRSSRRQGENGNDPTTMTSNVDPSKTTSKRLEALRLKNSTRNKLNTSVDEKLQSDKLPIPNESIEEKEEKVGGPLVGVVHPIHIFPLQILPCPRQLESVTQPLLYTPYPHPACSFSCLCCKCCSNQNLSLQQTIKKEGTWEIEHQPFTVQQAAAESSKKEDENSQRKGLRRRGDDNESKKQGNREGSKDSKGEKELKDPSLDEDATESDSLLPKRDDSVILELMSPSRRTEGLYPGEGPVITQLLLRSEPVDLPISAVVRNGVYLSRSTQRLLRDALAQYSDHTLRELWNFLQSTSHSGEISLPSLLSSAVEKLTNPVSVRNPFADAKSQSTSENWQHVLGYLNMFRGKSQPCGLSFLLHSETNSDPSMRLLEDWLDQRSQQQTHPATMKKSFFGDKDTSKERKQSASLGHIFDRQGTVVDQERKGVTLKVLANEIVLSDHPYMSEEEVTYVTLKRLYAQYSKHLRSKAYEYLPYRLLSLISELRSLLHPLNTAVQDLSPKEHESLIDHLYCDILETLPVMCEYKATLDDLEVNLYSTWRKLNEIRRKQGFVSTRAVLIAKNIQYAAADEDDDDEDKTRMSSPSQYNATASKYWKDLLSQLSTLPDIMKTAFEKSHPLPLESNPGDSNTTPRTESDGKVSTPMKRAHSSVPPPSSVSKKVQAEKPKQHAKAIEMIESAVEYLAPRRESKPTLLPTTVYRLSNTGTITPDDKVPHDEIERRNKLKRIRVRIVFKVHGQIVNTSNYYQLQWPDLKVHIDQLYELRVLRQPLNVVFDILVSYELKSSMLSCCGPLLAHETLVASVGVPLNQTMNDSTAHPALCFSPSVGWYEFTSQHLIDASRGRGLTYVNNKPASNLSTIRLAGALLCGSEYDLAYDPVNNSIVVNNTVDGVHGSDIAYIPPTEKGNHSAGRLIGGKLEFTREKDFFELLPPLHLLDIHDPRNDLIVFHQIQGLLSGRLRKRNIFQLGGEYFSSIHSEDGVSYGNYFKYQPSARLRLLRLRELKPYLFTEPIPLSEELIRTSELFKKILQNESKGRSSTRYLVDYIPESSAVEPDNLESEDETEGMTSDLHTKHVIKANTFLSRVRDSHIAISRQSRKKKVVTSSVVHEVLEPLNEWNFMTLFGSFGLPERKRALKPKPVDRTPEALPKKCDIMIQIVSARNVPLRVNMTGETGKKKSSGFGGSSNRTKSRKGNDENDESEYLLDDQDDEVLQDKKRVNTFVEVTFQENKVRTTSVEGSAPVWKQSVSLPFNPPHGEFNHSTLEQVTDMVTFTLFDEQVFDDSSRGGFLDGENTLREERFYLGSFSIPFSTILTEKRIEGTFRLETPSFNYGYVIPGLNQRKQVRREPRSAPGGILGLFGFGASEAPREESSPENEELIPGHLVKEFDIFCTTPSATTFLTVMVTLDPLLVTSPYVDSDVTISTTFPPDRPLVTYTQMWLQTIKDLGPHTKKRRYMLFGSNSDGLSVLICRYLKPLVPPPGVTSRRACIHVVSLLPFIPDNQAFVGEFDLWCTTAQSWQIMGGDEEEHATILYNYLYYLSLKARGEMEQVKDSKHSNEMLKDRFYLGYPSEDFIRKEELFLVLGEAIPEGNTVYVMMRASTLTKPTIQANGNEKNRSLDNTAKGWVFINPVNGNIYSAADPNCPLHEIFCLVTPYNIWTNIQKLSKPKDLHYDVFQLSHWRPLFGPRFRPNIPGLTPIQTEVAYEPTSPALCFEIEKILKNEIKAHLRKWRTKRAKSVTLHPEVSSIMTEILDYLEEWKMHGTIDGNSSLGGLTEEDEVLPKQSDGGSGGNRQSNISSSKVRLSSSSTSNTSTPYHILRIIEEKASYRLRNILHSNVLRGYPINTPYTDIQTILNKINLCCLHEIKHPDVLFVLSIKCFPLFNGLFSVWIFLGTLEKERS